tara:strand:- start:884 stop:2035 length:1152 start_codon:yes stop_codon:yes gene_type:complete
MDYSMQQYEPRGLESFQAEVSKIADLGRYEDAYIAHVAEGETVVPMEVLDSNPRLKAMLFNQMLDMGINPERYIVGNEFNSINPVTGQPEFFLKKIFKGAKKALKSIAPYAGTIAGIFGAGPMASALIGAGVPILAGGDAGDAIMGGIGGYGAGTAFGKGENYALRDLFSKGDEGGIGTAFQRVGENLGFGQEASGATVTEDMEKFTGIEAGTPISEIDPAIAEKYGYTYKSGQLINPASKAGFGAYANTAAFLGPPLVAAVTPEDQGSIMDDPSFASLYPQNTYFGQFGNRIPNNYQMSFAADGGIMDLEYMDKYAMGGEFPRRQGQISGPGGPKDDLVPAMLSDGEFVMTAKAVENAGGPRVMYNLMNSLDPDSSRGVGIA